MISEQLRLPIKSTSNSGDVLRSSCNHFVLKYINSWPEIFSQNHISIIVGEKASGKTTYLNIWKSKYKAFSLEQDKPLSKLLSELKDYKYFVIDDIENWGKKAKSLFHIINFIQDNGKFLLITSQSPDFEFNINDLNSRLCSSNLILIENMTEDLAAQIILKRFSDAQVRIDYNLIEFILENINISYGSVHNIIDEILEYSLNKVKITKKLLKHLLHLST